MVPPGPTSAMQRSMALRCGRPVFSLTGIVMLVLSTMTFLDALPPNTVPGIFQAPGFTMTSQFVFFCFIAAEVLRHLTRVVCYRREALV